MKSDEYIRIALSTITESWETQRDTIHAVSEKIAVAAKEKNKIYIFGCSHAGILAEEAFYRSGGLAIINPIFFPAMMLNTRPVTMTSKVERVTGVGKMLAEENEVGAGDVVLIHSVSGRNTVPVEFAMECAKRGAITVAITNRKYSESVTSRHSSGKRLFEVCDYVLDNCGCVGDAAVELDGLPERIGPTSTVCGTAILNGLIIEATDLILKEGLLPPVFMSANVDGGDDHNQKMLRQYKDQIRYM